MKKLSNLKNKSLLLPFLAPYAVYILSGILLDGPLSRQWGYAARIVCTGIAIIWVWKYYLPLQGPKSNWVSVIVGIIAGAGGCVLWVVLKKPFIHEAGKVWSDDGFVLRVVASGLLVPIFEEQFIRGYILRAAYQWDMARKRKEKEHDPFVVVMEKESVYDVPPGAWTFAAVIISTVAFTMGHNPSEWLACIAFSLIMVFLWVVRKDLLSCIVAHAVTNITLAFYIKSTGKWGLW